MHPPGSFCWFELSTTDQPAAKQFYEQLFGWTSEDSPIGPDEFYTTFKLDGEAAAAGYTMRADQRQAGVPPNWGLYVAVEAADAAAARAKELGGTVLAPAFDVGEHGRMAVIQDPFGAAFSVWQPKANPGTTVEPGAIGTACWADLSVPDQARAGEFYRLLFGWKMRSGKGETPARPGDYYHIVNGADFIGGIPPSDQRNAQAPPHWLIYFEVEDCAAATARAKGLGARAYVEPMAVGENGWVSVLADPQGAVFATHQTKK